MPCLRHSSASSLRGSRLKGVAATMLKGFALESNMAKPSWCLAVMTMYFMPADLARATMSCALKPVGLNCGGEGLVVGDGDGGVVHDPLADAGDLLAVPVAGGDGVEAPVDEHAEAGFAPPLHAGVASGRGFRCPGWRGRDGGRARRARGSARRTNGAAKRTEAASRRASFTAIPRAADAAWRLYEKRRPAVL